VGAADGEEGDVVFVGVFYLRFPYSVKFHSYCTTILLLRNQGVDCSVRTVSCTSVSERTSTTALNCGLAHACHLFVFSPNVSSPSSVIAASGESFAPSSCTMPCEAERSDHFAEARVASESSAATKMRMMFVIQGRKVQS
jgi:hypothetical protein